jgi:hypothetical protein
MTNRTRQLVLCDNCRSGDEGPLWELDSGAQADSFLAAMRRLVGAVTVIGTESEAKNMNSTNIRPD